MFDAVRNNKRIVQGFLLLITVPFAVWGLDSYIRGDAGATQVAKVGGTKITLSQFQQSLREQQEQMRARFPGVDAKLLDSPAIRKSVLDGLVDQQLLLAEASKHHLNVGDKALQEMIVGIPAFQENGKFSQARYEAALASQNMTPVSFEFRLRRDLTLQLLIGALGESAFVSREVADRVVALQGEVRQVQEYRLPWESLQGQVKLEEAELKKYYDDNSVRYTLPEQVKLEYVVLSQKALEGQSQVTEKDARAWYDSHLDRFTEQEQRRASHILLNTEGADKVQVQARAEALLAELKKNPGQFAELARKNSQDTGSAAKGGDLGFFAKGAMVKAFEETVFKLQEGEISGVVESDFGFHIIKLTGIQPAKVKSFEAVKLDVEAEMKRQNASRLFADAAEKFSNLVYEQADSLKPAAEAYKLSLQQSGWVTRQPGGTTDVLLNNPKLLEVVFVDEVLNEKSRRNTRAVEVQPGTLVSARVIEYKPSALKPFETVRAEIEAVLKREKALVLARQQGEEKLAALNAGKSEGVTWAAPQNVSRMDPGKVPVVALSAVFQVDGRKLPTYAGVEVPGAGYLLYKVNKVEAGRVEEAQSQALHQQLATLEARTEVAAYMAALRTRYKVEINSGALEESKER